MGNSKQLFLFFLLVMVKWEYVVSGYEVPMGIISSAVLPSDDEEEVEEKREPANVVMNEIPVQEHQEMIPHLNKESPPSNRLLNLYDSSGSSMDIYNSLAKFLPQLNLFPGKTIRVEIIPPEGSETSFINDLMGNLKVIMPKLVTNAQVSFKLGATRNVDDTLKKITLDIIVGPAIQETFDRFGNDEIPKSNILTPIDVDLTSEPDKQDITLTTALVNGLKLAKPYIDTGKSSTMILHISPPSGSRSNDEQITIRRITRILNQLVHPNVRTIVHGRSSNYPDGTVKNVDVEILLEPTQESNGENIEIDLSSPGKDIQKTLRDNLLLILQNERSKKFNLVIIPPVGTTPQTSDNIVNMVNSILLQFVPNRKPAIKYKISQEPNGYVDKIYVEIDIEPSSTPNNSIDLHFDVNLSFPNKNLKEEILRIIPKVKNVLSQQPTEPISFTMDIKPPKGATDEYVTETLKTVQETLLDVLPSNKIGVQARITKDSQGNIVNISVISNIEPMKHNPENELNFDLSKPERNLVDYLIKFTPQLKNILEKENPENEPASLTVNIQPPIGANDQFVRNSMNTVTSFLSKLLPDKEISVEAKATKDTDGNVISTSLFITSKSGATTEHPKNPEKKAVDLSDPDVNLDDIVLDILPHLQKPENDDDNENEPRTYSLNLIPPKGSGMKFVQDKMNYIANKLSKYLPMDKINVQSKITKDSDGNIVNITLVIIAERKPSNKKPKHLDTINLDLSQPATDIEEQIIEIIPRIKSVIQNQPQDKPVEFNLDIQPPKGATDEFVKYITNKVKTDLNKELPSRNIKLQPKVVKDDSGNIIDIILIVDIEPTKNSKVTTNPNGDLILTLNLEKPDSNVETEITKVVPYITENLKKQRESKKPEKFILKIIPPKKANNEYVETTMDTIRNNLLRIYPDKKVEIKGNVIKDDEGNVTDLKFDITFEPTGTTLNETTENPFIETVVTSETPTESQKTITVNLDKPGVNLVQEIMKIIPTIRRNVEENEITNEPYNFEMNIVPPKGANENFIRDTSNYIVTAFSQFFPKNKIGLKAKTIKDDKGNIKNVSYVVSIEPKQSSENINLKTTTASSQEVVEEITTTESGSLIEVTEISTTRPNIITVNFDKPGVDLKKEIEKQLPTLKDDVEKSNINEKPVSFEMNVQPPKGAKDDFVKDTSETLITTLSHLFPNNKIEVKAKTRKNDEGNIVDITYEINILPATSSSSKTTTPSSRVEEITLGTTENDNLIVVTEVTTKKPKIITVNFDKPGVDLKKEIKKQLPTLEDDVEESNMNAKPVTFEMNVQPPEGAKNDFVKDTSKTLITTLSHLFPNNKIGVKAKTTKDNQGNIVDIDYVINILPATSSPSGTTTPSSLVEEITPGTTENNNLIVVTEITTKKPKTITVNFDKPGVDLTKEIKKQLPNLEDDVEESNINEKPVSFEMNVQPPEGSKDDFVKDTSQSLVTTLSHLFPNNKIAVKAKTTKDDEGNIIDISYVINILPNMISKSTPFELISRTTTPSSQEFLDESTLRSTEPATLTEITEPTTKPPEIEEKKIDIDLSKPGSSLTEHFEEILLNIIKPLKKDLNQGNPVTFNFDIEPPAGSTDDFIKTTRQSLLPILTKYFPNNKIDVKANGKKNGQGLLTDVVMTVNIEPSNELGATTPTGFIDLVVTPTTQQQEESTTPKSNENVDNIDSSEQTTKRQQEPTTPVNEQQEKTVDVDLTRPGSSLLEEVEEILPKIIKPLKKDLNEGKPVTFNFDIEPPAKTTEDFLKTAPKSLLPVLTKYFPYDKINVKTTAKKDSQGFLTDVVLSVTVEPINEQETTTPPKAEESTTPKSEEITTVVNEPQQKNVDVDLTNPGSNLPEEVEEILPKIIKPLKKDLNEGKPVTLNFDIEPPAKTTEDFLKTAPKSLLPVLTKYFPYDKINVKTTAKKDSQGFLTDVVLSVTVEPINEQETTTRREAEESTTPKSKEITTVINEPQQKNVDVDLTNPGSNLPKEVEEILPKIIKPLKKDLNEGKPVTLNFDIEPPAKTTEDFLKTAPKSLLPVLTKYFPYDKINVKTTAKKDSQGFLTDVVLSVTVEPINEQETTTPPKAEESTTPKSEEITTVVNEPQQKNVDVDLTNPGSNLPEEVEEILPKIIKPLKKDLNEGKPVTLNFDIEPPAKTTEDFLKTAPKSLLPVLTKYFPYDKINVKTTAKKDSQGFLTDVVLSVTVEPINEQETTTRREAEESTTPKSKEITTVINEPQQKNVDVDLTNPGSNLPEEVEEILPKIIKPLKKDLNEGKPVTLNFDIEPPAKTTEDFLKTAPKSLLPVLTKYFPYDKINVKTTAKKDSQGFLTDVVLSVTVEPINEQETTTRREAEESTTPKSEEITTVVNEPQRKTVDVDLTNPGSNLPEEVEEILPKIIKPLKKDLNEGKPVTLNFDIEPPAKTTEDFLKTAPKSLLPVLTKYFPYDKINVKTTAKKDSQGFLTDVVLSVTVEPINEQETATRREAEKSTTPKSEEITTVVNEPQRKTVDVDLTNPGSNLPEEVEEILPKIIKPLKKDLNEGKPVTLNFDIEPPAKTTEDFLKTAPKSLLPVLTKYFPYDKINVKTTAKKDSQGFLTDVVLSVTVEPINEQETTTRREAEESTTPKSEEITPVVNEPQQKTVDVDLTNPGSNLPEEVEEILPKIIKPLKKDLNEGKPVTLNFDIEPPAKTTEDFLKTAPKSLLPVLTKYFPYDKINVKTTAKKDSQGFLTDVVLSVTVEPINEQETTTRREAEESTTPKSEEITTVVNEPQRKTVDVDLTNPGSNLPEEVEEILPKIIKPLKKDLNEGKPVTLNFDIEPPAKTTEDFLKTAPKSLLPVLTKYFPYDKINVKTTAKKDSQGFLTDVVLSVTVEPINEQETATRREAEKSTTPKSEEITTVVNEPQRKTVDVDLTNPGSNLPEEVEEILPKIIKPLKKDLNEGKPVTLNFDIEPPAKTTEDFLKTAPKSLLPVLTKYFPYDKINVKTTAKKDSQGFLTDVVLSVTVEPINEQETTTRREAEESTTPKSEEITPVVNEPQQKTVDVDLTNPGSNLPAEVEEILPKIIKPLKKDLNEGKPVTLNFDIEPPAKTTEDFLKTAPKSLLPVLTKYFPYDKINVKTTAKKDSQGFLTDVVLSVTVEPINEQETTTPREAEESTSPKSEEITTVVNEPQRKTVDVDLTNPGSNLPEEVEEILPKIIKPLKKDLNQGKPVTLNFDIEPPAKTTEDFLKTAPKSLLPVLTKYFPYDKINVKTTAKKDSQGFLTDVVLSVTVEPINEQETTTRREAEESTTPKSKEITTVINEPQQKNVDVDLTNPGSNLPEEVEEILPKIIKPLKKDLNEGKPVTLNFDIEPPAKTTEDFLKTAPKSLLPVLTKYFPYDKINVKTTAKKDSQGFLTDVVLSVTVEPINEQETTTRREAEESTTPKSEEITTVVNEPQRKTVDVDLTNPGSNLPEEVEEVLPKIIKPLKKDLNEGKPVTLNFDIEPPAKTTEDFLKTAPKSLLPVLTKYFPYDKINVKTTAKKDSQGFLTDVVLSVTVEPSNVQETTPGHEVVESTTPITQEDYENIVSSEQTTSRQQEITTLVNEHQIKTVDIDLSNPGSKLPEEVEEILPKIIKPLKKDLKEGKPITLNFDIEPPARTTDGFLKTAPNSLIPILTKYFPKDKINVKTTAKKNSEGFLTDIVLSVTVEPMNEQESSTPEESQGNVEFEVTTSRNVEITTPSETQETDIDIDLSTPGSSLPEQVEEILPLVISPLKKDLNDGKPVTLNFDIEPPPRSTDNFLKTAPQSLLPLLTKYFPNNKINLKTNANQNSQGYLTKVTLSVNIEPNNEPESTTPVEIRKKNIDIDLSQPDSSLPEQVEQVLPQIIDPVKNELNEGTPVTLDFNIEPPPYTTKDFLQTAPQSLVPILTKYFPNNKISLKTEAKQNSQGFLTDVTLSVNIEPNNESESTTPVETKKKNIDIDLSQPGSSLPEQVEQVLPQIIDPVKNELNEGTPVTLDFNIEPPPYSTEDFLQTAPQSLVPILTKYFPNNKISLKTNAKQNSQGFLTDVTLSVNIEPNNKPESTTPVDTKKKNIDIDLSQPGSSFPEQVEKVLPKIINPVKNELNEGTPVSLDFNIEPPPYSTKDFLQTAPQYLVPILTKYFPNNKISLKTNAREDKQGFLTDVVLSINIEPNNESTETKQNIDIDLTEPGSSLPEKIETILPQVLKPIKNNLNKGSPTTIDFNIDPPSWSTSNFLKTAPQSVVSILSKYFPNNKIHLKTKATQDNNGFLTNVVLSVIIEPNEETTITKPKERNVDIDLSQPGTTLPGEMKEIMLFIAKPVTEDLKKKIPVTLKFNIEPPPRSTAEFLQTAPQSIVAILTDYFPNNKMSLKTNAKKNFLGYLSDVVLSITIEPSDDDTPSENNEGEENINVDLSKPGSSITNTVNNELPNIVPKIREGLKNQQQMTIKFNIQPPEWATQDNLQSYANSLMPVLSSYFPNNQIKVKAKAQKNSMDYLTFASLIVTIEPASKTQEDSNGLKINIDLSNQNNRISDQVKQVIPSVISYVQNQPQNGQPIILYFEIKLPRWASREYIKTATNYMERILSDSFPQNRLQVQISNKEGFEGLDSVIVMKVTLIPEYK